MLRAFVWGRCCFFGFLFFLILEITTLKASNYGEKEKHWVPFLVDVIGGMTRLGPGIGQLILDY